MISILNFYEDEDNLTETKPVEDKEHSERSTTAKILKTKKRDVKKQMDFDESRYKHSEMKPRIVSYKIISD